MGLEYMLEVSRVVLGKNAFFSLFRILRKSIEGCGGLGRGGVISFFIRYLVFISFI